MKVKKFLKTLLPAILFLLINVIVTYALMFVKAVEMVAKTGNTDAQSLISELVALAQSSDFLLSVTLIFEVVSFIVFTIIYFAGMKSKFNTFTGHMTVKSVGIIAVLFIGVELLLSECLVLLNEFAPSLLESYNNLIESSGLADMTVLSTILTLVCAPIVEEIVFRGITLKWASDFTDKFMVANIIQAVLFGIAHMNLIQGIYAALLGFVLGLVYKKYKSLWASIIGHLVFNFSGTYLVSLLFGSGMMPDWLSYVVCFVLAVVALFFGYKLLKKEPAYIEQVNNEPIKEPVIEGNIAE